jgi:UDP-3-O-[3-hydroxymyristoyl] glucosamine N-acyltransferase
MMEASAALSLAEVAVIASVALPPGADAGRMVRGAGALEGAGADQIAYMDNAKYADALAATRAGVCLVSARFATGVPKATVALVCKEPYRAYAKVVTQLYPEAMRLQSRFGQSGVSPHALIHPTARLGDGAAVDPGAVVGPGA